MSIYDLIKNQIDKWMSQIGARPLIIGLSGPQGCGKTTVVRHLSNDPSIVSLSLDDFYYGHDIMAEIAKSASSNPFLQHRGCPGTHDIALLKDDLVSGRNTVIPKYDKSAYQGRGDRCPESSWTNINFTPRLVILEGWCLGFTKTDQFINDPNLAIINQNLEKYKVINQYFNAFIHLVAEDIGFVYDWRQEQEDMLRMKLGDPNAGLNKEKLKDFIDRFIPVYGICVSRLRKSVVPTQRHLEIIMDHDRKIISHTLI